MKRFNLFLAVVALLFSTLTAAADGTATITPAALTCEYAADPVIDIQNPRFSWINENTARLQGAAQTAYRIRVATSPDDFSAPVWDTGKVRSAESAFITYKGKPLQSRTSYWWQVMVWDEQGRASAWSEPARWHMGLLSKDEWQGEWIGAPWQGEESYDVMGSKDVMPAPLLRKEFSVNKKVKEARFYGTGLGYFELYINGQRVGEDYLSPNQTNYTTRPTLDTRGIVVTDPFEEYLVMYLTHEVESLLVEGENAVGVVLGNGFYDMVRHWPAMGYGTPRFMGQIEILYEDGTREIIASDTSWRAERSAITSDQIFFGEHYDARLEHKGWATSSYDDTAWQQAAVKKAPEGKLIPQNGPADRITKRYAPIEFEKKEDHIRIKFPEEISGWLALKNIKAEKGQKIDIKYVSESPGNGTNSYIASGSGDESYHARFTWFVFSEVEVRGIDNLTAEQVEAHAVNSDVDVAGEFTTSNDLINTINKIWRRSQLDNMHGAIASDCPHRERSPYTGDGQVACVTVMHNFDAQTFYNKWLRDIRGSQTPGGYVPNGAPWQPGCGGGVGWGAAMEIMPWEFYLHYGDRRVLEQNFNAMRRHVRWMTTWVDSDTGLMLSHDEQQWKNLGDWLPPRELPRAELVHTYFLWQCADIAVRAAHSLGEDATEFEKIRDNAAKAFHDNLYDPATGSYGKYGSNVLALKIGVPEERKAKVVEALRQNIAEVNDHLDTGIVATRFLFEVLCDNGLKDLAYKIINQRDFPSFGWWIEQGATVTWEQWDGGNSHNHPMFGGGIGWFYRDLAGLRVKDAGFRSFDVRPVVPAGLEWVEYTHDTTYGQIAIRWEHKDGRFKLICDVPVGSTATLWLPFEGAAPEFKESENIIRKGVREGYALYKVRSGHYEFETAL